MSAILSSTVTEELDRILRCRAVDTHFQPLFATVDRQVFGHEALARTVPGSGLQGPEALFNAAALAGRSVELDLLLLELAVRRFGAARGTGRLFVNLMPQTLLATGDLTSRLDTWLGETGLRTRDVVVELTEHGLGEDIAALRRTVRALRDLGCEFAIDDLGAGSSGLKVWSALRPDYVKLDRFFTAQVHDPIEAEILRSVLDMAHVMGSRVVAEGVESPAQCALLTAIGVDYLQGFVLAQPQAQPLDTTEDHSGIWAGIASAAPVARCVADFLEARPPIEATRRIADIVTMFRENVGWDSVAVVESGRALGVIRRDALLTLLSKPLYPEIYHRKPASTVMDERLIAIDERTRLDQASRLVTGHGLSRVNEDFLITRHGQYAGIGRTIELLRQITAQQVETASQSNPLTRLPGNRQIDEELDRLLALRTAFVVCHADLDHFKAYNDEYGYRQGDQVLLHVAGLLQAAVSRSEDFVGHIGGDDFLLLMRSEDWEPRLQGVLDSLAASLRNFYSANHLADGGFTGVDRQGRSTRFPLLALSIGAVQSVLGCTVHRDALLDRLTTAKHHAKASAGNALCLLPADGGDEAGTPDVAAGDAFQVVARERRAVGRHGWGAVEDTQGRQERSSRPRLRPRP
jgi:EAL domain-containing protein (putative c-di-GMP-specific phosphodiesterase class I)/GGDEF domain-containing protein